MHGPPRHWALGREVAPQQIRRNGQVMCAVSGGVTTNVLLPRVPRCRTPAVFTLGQPYSLPLEFQGVLASELSVFSLAHCSLPSQPLNIRYGVRFKLGLCKWVQTSEDQ